ncbi:MAG: chromate efflux transporter [Nevskiaceae bacterium]|nr:MAG: chromate efflux transporter [Nevskiaceae bacterium]
MPDSPQSVTFREAFLVWLKIGFLNFGGPAGQIALMHRILVDEKRWISETRFLHALNYCMLLPGPEAQQLATYVGWLLHRTAGGLAAGLLFILPGFILMTLIATVYVLYGDLSWMQGLLFGMQAATLAIVLEAVMRVGKKALKHPALYLLAGASFIAIFAFGVPFPAIILTAGLIGMLGKNFAPGIFLPNQTETRDSADQHLADHTRPPASWTLRVLFTGAALWGLPVLLLFLTLGARHVFTQEAVFFSKMAVVTFGGAYAVLAYMAQQAVERYGWLLPGEMVQGLALAETTPGPLILVLTYVGFLGAHRDPGSLDPLLAGMLGGLISTWVTFVPCFLWIFLGAPYIERLRGNPWLTAALSAITAVVVGVILNLSIWFGLHVLFANVSTLTGGGLRMPVPVPSSINLMALLLSAGAMLALFRFRISLLPTLAAAAAIGLAMKLLGLV